MSSFLHDNVTGRCSPGGSSPWLQPPQRLLCCFFAARPAAALTPRGLTRAPPASQSLPDAAPAPGCGGSHMHLRLLLQWDLTHHALSLQYLSHLLPPHPSLPSHCQAGPGLRDARPPVHPGPGQAAVKVAPSCLFSCCCCCCCFLSCCSCVGPMFWDALCLLTVLIAFCSTSTLASPSWRGCARVCMQQCSMAGDQSHNCSRSGMSSCQAAVCCVCFDRLHVR